MPMSHVFYRPVMPTGSRYLPGRFNHNRRPAGIPDVVWEEQIIPQLHPLYQLFSSPPAVKLVTELLGMNRECCDLTCWVARYRGNEYIGPHKDGAGSIQAVVSLKQSAGSSGGKVNLIVNGQHLAFNLFPGDALFLRARLITHFTTPMVWMPHLPPPIRVVTVARYFKAGVPMILPVGRARNSSMTNAAIDQRRCSDIVCELKGTRVACRAAE